MISSQPLCNPHALYFINRFSLLKDCTCELCFFLFCLRHVLFSQVITKLVGMENEPELAYTSKKDQADLLTKVLAASDKEADEEDLSSLVRTLIL